MLPNLSYTESFPSPFIDKISKHSIVSPLGEIDFFGTMSDSDLSEIEKIATNQQSIHWARYCFQTSLKSAVKAKNENKDLEEINNLVEKTLTWHYRSLVVAQRDRGISKDNTIDATGWINMDHSMRLGDLSDLIDQENVKPKDYIIPAIAWTRKHKDSWPSAERQDIADFGMGFFTNDGELENTSNWNSIRTDNLDYLEDILLN